ncbi:hypothetical protein [Sphingomonas sp. 22176]|uniref:hypothetical protein n=1 Tax=Sphingomonas sp. 22176 TaxID=3453884 RepID=UPI003F8282C9
MSFRARCPSSRCGAAVSCRSRCRTRTSVAASFPLSLKEGRAALAPVLPRDHIGQADCGEQRARQLLHRQCIGTGRDHQFAELLELGLFEVSRLAVERLQFRIEVTWFSHFAL